MNLTDLIPGISYLKLAMYGTAVLAILGVFTYAWHIYSEAAKVPGLEQTITEKQGQIDYAYGKIFTIGNQLVLVQKDRDKYHDDLIVAYATIDDMIKELQNGKKNSPVSNNAICKPTDAEQLQFNSITRSLQQQFEQPTEASGLPKAQ